MNHAYIGPGIDPRPFPDPYRDKRHDERQRNLCQTNHSSAKLDHLASINEFGQIV